jgi:hypothetical protein
MSKRGCSHEEALSALVAAYGSHDRHEFATLPADLLLLADRLEEAGDARADDAREAVAAPFLLPYVRPGQARPMACGRWWTISYTARPDLHSAYVYLSVYAEAPRAPMVARVLGKRSYELANWSAAGVHPARYAFEKLRFRLVAAIFEVRLAELATRDCLLRADEEEVARCLLFVGVPADAREAYRRRDPARYARVLTRRDEMLRWWQECRVTTPEACYPHYLE